MKFWKRIFLYTFILFIFVFNIAGIIIIENIYSRNINTTIKNVLNESKDIVNTIYLNSDSGGGFWTRLRSYIGGDFDENRKIEVISSKDGKIVMETSKLDLGKDRIELENISNEEYRFIIKNYEGKKYLSVNHLIQIKGENFKVIVTRDITYLKAAKKDDYEFFLFLSLASSIILGMGLYIIVKKLTMPIEGLSLISSNIKNGDYSKRSNYKQKDEVGILAENFNSMMGVIEDNIEELKETSNQKQRFIDNLTHEMKTPITSILGYSELLLKGNLNDEIKFKALTNINLQGKRLEGLNTSLIKLIMIRNNRCENELLSVNQIVQGVYANYNLEEKKIKIVRDIKEGQIIGDKELIGVLINNIIDNAIKASKENSIVEIIGKPQKDKSLYILEIKDNGVGISREDINKIKEPFYMADKARNTKGKNVGLGLAICSDICELNKIIFNIESKVNGGTKVILKFRMESFK